MMLVFRPGGKLADPGPGIDVFAPPGRSWKTVVSSTDPSKSLKPIGQICTESFGSLVGWESHNLNAPH